MFWCNSNLRYICIFLFFREEVRVPDDSSVEVSVVVPARNESLTVGRFIEWCEEGFRRANISGEIIILDSSTDDTPEIARKMGAVVVEVKGFGLGNAYKQGRGVARGKYVIMGDADCTYDFREISIFTEKLKEGFDLVVGNRFRGNIESGSMPVHHRYFGSPLTSWVFNRALGIPTGDIHCGMRALTLDLYKKLPFTEPGWEYSTEMIVSARNLDARIGEIPINFLKEPEGRISHLKRSSWLLPFKAGWGTLRVTTTFMFDRLFTRPGMFISGITELLLIGLAINPAYFRVNLHIGILSQTILLLMTTLGSFMFSIGTLSGFFYYRDGHLIEKLRIQRFANRIFSITSVFTILEISLSSILIIQWRENIGRIQSLGGLPYSQELVSIWFAATGLFIIAISTLVTSLMANHLHKSLLAK
jgi:glycosyltransferase involved in cell wall biosynthesis